MKRYFYLVFFTMLYAAISSNAQTINTLRSTEDSVLVTFIITDLDSVPIENAKLVVTTHDKSITKEGVSDILGKCYMLLTEGKTYSMVVYKFRTDFPFHEHLHLPVEKGRYSFDQEIRIKLIRDFARIFTLDNVYFDVNKWDIKPECTYALDNLYNTLKLNPNMKIEIAGHTDSDGDSQANLILSQNRAESVMNYLIKMGLNPERIQAKGYGEFKPLVPNDSAPNKAKNRRTEVRVLDE
ncbi:OmpA family protein [Cytophaga aurantiaca]|uniref:OmpA family protein n=1 Tax=Cytophaga aurantiaca TaxID=29530 RepID=UPI0003A315C1|nr:OmpA family protein [Cytophaga aurantiaca]